MEDMSVTDGVAPRLMLQMCLPYRHCDPGRERVTPMGVRLRVKKGKLPVPLDRLVMLFLTALASRHSEARVSISAIARWVGKRRENHWRIQDVGERLQRLLNCEIEMAGADGLQRFAIAEHPCVDVPYDRLYVKFSEEFRRAAQDSVVIPREHVRALSGHPFVLEVYTLLRFLLHDGVWSRKWDLRKLIRSSGTRHHFGGRLKQALEMLARVLPAGTLGPFERSDVQCVRCDYDAYRVHAYGVDLEEENQQFAAEIAGMSRSEVRTHFLAQPEWRRSGLYMKYLDERMRPAALEMVDRTGAVVDQAAATARAIEVRTDKLRELRRKAEATAAGLRAAAEPESAPVCEPVAEPASIVESAESAAVCAPVAEFVESAPVVEPAEPFPSFAQSAHVGKAMPPARHRGRSQSETARAGRDRQTSPRQCASATASRPPPSSRWRRIAARARARASGSPIVRLIFTGQPEPSADRAGKRHKPARRAREAIGQAASRMARTLAKRSSTTPATSPPSTVPADSRIVSPKQAATLAAALGIVQRDRDQARAGPALSADDLATLKAGLDILGVVPPEPARTPAGTLHQVARRAGALIAGRRKPGKKSKRRRLLARLRRGGEAQPDG